MSKAEELASLYERSGEPFHKETAAELRRLAALEQAAEPVIYQFQAQDGTWRDFIDQRHYQNTVDDGRWPIRALYTHPAPRKPMTQADMQKLLSEHFDNDELTGADYKLIRAVERFHGIKE